MGRRCLYPTPELRAEAERRWRANATESTRANRAAYIASEAARALAAERYRRYRQTDGYKAAQERYRATEKKRRADAAYREHVRITEPERRKARAAVQTLVRRGDIVAPVLCGQCGLPKPLDAHHHLGYAVEHWLTVQWLCRACHKALHAA